MTWQTLYCPETDEWNLMAAWIQRIESEKNQAQYRRFLERFYGRIERSIRDISLLDLEDFKGSSSHLAHNTRCQEVKMVRSYLKFAFKAGFIDHDLGTRLTNIKPISKAPDRILSRDEIVAVLKEAKNDRDRTIIELFYASGIRVSGLVGLSCGDLICRDGSNLVRVFEKGKERFVDLTGHGALWDRLGGLNPGGDVQDPVFLNRYGDRITETSVQRIVKDLGKKAGIKKPVTPHCFRHSHCNHALKAGVPLLALKESVGHEKLESTQFYLQIDVQESSASYIIAPE